VEFFSDDSKNIWSLQSIEFLMNCLFSHYESSVMRDKLKAYYCLFWVIFYRGKVKYIDLILC